MPNECFNGVEVHGDREQLKSFKEHVRLDSDRPDAETRFFSLHAIVPMPVEVQESTSWYDWAVEHWGTKSDCWGAEMVHDGESSVVFRFSTAWQPPWPVIKALREQFPDVRISWYYHEPMAEIAGYA